MADLDRDIRDLVLRLAAKKAKNKARMGVSSTSASKETVRRAVRADLVSVGVHDGQTRYFLSREGVRRVKGWIEKGADEDDRPLGPEWLGRLRHLYG
jgi:hypothetical protein